MKTKCLSVIILATMSVMATMCSKSVNAIDERLDPIIAETVSKVCEDSLGSYIDKLVSFHTRHSMSSQTDPERGLGAAVNWLKTRCEDYAARAEGIRPRPFVETIYYKTSSNMDREVTVPDILVTIPGTAGESEILVMAHIDTRVNNLADSTTFAPGANDDGSGISCLLEIVRLLSEVPLEQTVKCLFVTCEEQSLGGSAFMAAKAREENWPLIAVINNDMIGNAEASGTHLVETDVVRIFSESRSGVDSNERQLARYVKEIGERYVPGHTVKLMYRADRYRRGGDHSSFVNQGFTAVRMTEYYENYDRTHQVVREEDGIAYGDMPSGVCIPYLAKNIKVNLASIMNLADAPMAPAHAEIANANELSNYTILKWEQAKDSDGKIDQNASYEILYRETDQPEWKILDSCNADSQNENLSIEIPLSKDNYFFAVRSISAKGNASLPAFCR
ncbi:MAG: M28 family metallopeptidase [Bacteroidales bacterium]|nr:M28 family metallopeptidase [Bacteroidales bacterium]